MKLTVHLLGQVCANLWGFIVWSYIQYVVYHYKLRMHKSPLDTSLADSAKTTNHRLTVLRSSSDWRDFMWVHLSVQKESLNISAQSFGPGASADASHLKMRLLKCYSWWHCYAGNHTPSTNPEFRSILWSCLSIHIKHLLVTLCLCSLHWLPLVTYIRFKTLM